MKKPGEETQGRGKNLRLPKKVGSFKNGKGRGGMKKKNPVRWFPSQVVSLKRESRKNGVPGDNGGENVGDLVFGHTLFKKRALEKK